MSTNKPISEFSLNRHIKMTTNDGSFEQETLQSELDQLRSDLTEAVGLLGGLLDESWSSILTGDENWICNICGDETQPGQLCTNPDCPAVKTRGFLGRMEATDDSDA